MMTREIKNVKYQSILNAGKRLFWKYGIKKVTVEDICREAGISRMTFYKHFPNKVDLAVYILKQLFNEYYDYFNNLFTSDLAFEEQLKRIIKIKLEASKNMSMEIVRDIYQSDIPELVELMENQKQKSSSITLDFIMQGKNAGYIRKDLKNEFVLFQLNQILEMMKSDELFTLYDDTQIMTKNILDYFFNGILNKEN